MDDGPDIRVERIDLLPELVVAAPLVLEAGGEAALVPGALCALPPSPPHWYQLKLPNVNRILRMDPTQTTQGTPNITLAKLTNQ